MKSILITILVLGSAVVGLWWYADKRTAEIEAQKETRRVAEENAVREERLELFGEAALNPEIVWSELSGLGILILEEGTGAKPLPGAEVTFSYKVTLKDGTEVDRTGEPTDARIGQMISGVSAGLMKTKGGGRSLLFIPAKLAYGRQAYGPIPKNSALLFEIELMKP
ncbi:MAG: FKBP-type peptidyl-prolyl cis-trans isomerase [Verrucomicrobiia bacterium]|tara:strand:+ start:27866 stop:28366 length:501 start_codon:yes stop_codon:yes gene_type:complete